MDIFEMAIAKALAGGNSGGGGGNSGGNTGGGLTIKEITFTDRPSMYAWLQENSQKLLKVAATSPIFAAPLNLSVFDASIGETNEYSLSTFSAWCTEDVVHCSCTTITLYGTYTKFVMGNDGQEGDVQEIPDEYWAAIGLEVKVYYLE